LSLPFHLAIGGFDDDDNGILSIESYDIHTNQWTILTSIPGMPSQTWSQSIGVVNRCLYISVCHKKNPYVVTREGYFFDLNTEKWSKAPVIHDRARHCTTVQFRFSKKSLQTVSMNMNRSLPISLPLNHTPINA
jgi:hypothetical protein